MWSAIDCMPATLISILLAPSSAPSTLSVVSVCATSVTVNWTYDTNDADGYVVYYNNGVKKVEGGHMNETTLDGLIPGTNYSITVRAYQHILGPPSTPLMLIAPSPPSNVNVIIDTPHSLQVTWNTMSNTKGYVVVYSNDTGNYTLQVYTNTATISHVTLHSTYSISVYGYYDLSSNESGTIYIFNGG